MNTIRPVTFSLLCFILSQSESDGATVIPAVWESSTQGTIDGVSFTAGGFALQQVVLTDFSGEDYSFMPLSVSEQSLSYWEAGGSHLITLDIPLENVLLYAKNWTGLPSNGEAAIYTIGNAFEIVSGFTGATVSGNTLTIPDGEIMGGIIKFTGPVSSISFPSTGPTDGRRSQTTIAVVPELGSSVLLLAGILCTMGRRRFRK